MLKLPIKWPVPWLIVKNKKTQLLLLYLCFSPHFEVIGFVILFKCRLRAVSLFSWSVEENARDTQMTTRVTEGARRAGGCRPRHAARRSRACLPPTKSEKKRDCLQSTLSKSIPWGGGGGHSRKVCVEVCLLDLQRLNPFKTNIFHFVSLFKTRDLIHFVCVQISITSWSYIFLEQIESTTHVDRSVFRSKKTPCSRHQ